MKQTLEEIKAAFEGKEPCQGGWGSEFRFEEAELDEFTAIEVTLLCDWKPRYLVHTVFVFGVDNGLVTFIYDDGDPANPQTLTVEKLAAELADRDG